MTTQNQTLKQRGIAAWVFGGLLLLFLLAIFFVIPEPTTMQWRILCFVLATLSGFLSHFWGGRISLKGKVIGSKVTAAGSVAIFLVVLITFTNMPESFIAARTWAAEHAPSIVPADGNVAEMQRHLSELGYRTGPINGIRDAATTDGVKRIQTEHGIPPSGMINSQTIDIIRAPARRHRAGILPKEGIEISQSDVKQPASMLQKETPSQTASLPLSPDKNFTGVIAMPDLEEVLSALKRQPGRPPHQISVGVLLASIAKQHSSSPFSVNSNSTWRAMSLKPDAQITSWEWNLKLPIKESDTNAIRQMLRPLYGSSLFVYTSPGSREASIVLEMAFENGRLRTVKYYDPREQIEGAFFYARPFALDSRTRFEHVVVEDLPDKNR